MDSEYLRQIAENTRPRESLSIIVRGDKSKIITRYSPPIQLDKTREWEMALIDLETYYSFPNIGEENNVIKWSKDGGANWHTFKLPKGAYDLTEVADAIQTEVVKKGGGKKAIRIDGNKVTLKCIIELATNYRIDFNVENSLRTVLGFQAKIYDQPVQMSEAIVNILNVNTIDVHIDVIGGSYVKGSRDPIIYSFFPNANPGEKIVERPQNLVYLPVHSYYINSITMKLTDQDGKLLDLRDEKLSARFHLRSK